MRRMWAAAAAALLALLIGPAAYGEEPAAIRDFDIATIESLGNRIYQQDQLAWKATDVLLAKHSPEELRRNKASGWIVDDELHRVRFIRDGAGGPETAYDVMLVPGMEPTLSEPANRTLTAVELAQYKARTLAATDFDFRCTSTTPNTVALPDPQRKGWLVWVMSATKNPDEVVVAGHIRYSISEDGGTIVQKDKLSKSCMVTNKPREKKGEKLFGQLFTNIVSLKPVETQVFTSLAYGVPLYIGTKDGLTWKIETGHITAVDEDAPDPDGVSARALAGFDEICSPIFASTDPQHQGYTLGGTIQVISRLENNDTLDVDVPKDKKLSAVVCVRNSIISSPNDYKLLAAGIVLYISDKGAGHPPKRRVELAVENGQLVVRFKEGALFGDEGVRLQNRLDKMQTAYRKAKTK